LYKNDRLISLDVFRGITIAGMILVNNPGTWSDVYPPLMHAEWHGCTPTDLIFPFFLFIVGVAITLSLVKRQARGDNQNVILFSVIRRSIILFLLGLILNAFPYFNLSTIRIPGILQRIAVVYFISSVIFLRVSFKWQIYTTIVILLLYWLIMTLIPVPGVGEANLGNTTNLAAWLDNSILGGHLWSYSKVWDPEGILSTLPAIGTALIGIITGNWLKTDKDRLTKTVWMFVYGVTLLSIGYIWSGWFPMNKNLWTSSYVLYTGGIALLFLTMCYWLIDVQKVNWWVKPFQVYGMNAITVFFLSSLISKLLYIVKFTDSAGQEITVKGYLFTNLFLSWLSPINASFFWAFTYVLFWMGIMWILYKKNIFIKV
jgi:predicted acyltransferase